MIAATIVLFVLADGLVARNEFPWAAPWRAGLLIALYLFGLAGLAWHHIKLEPVPAILMGVLAAMIVSDSFNSAPRPGIALWAIMAGVFLWGRAIQYDWTVDLARAGLALSILVLIAFGCWLICGIAIPQGAWNRNVVAGTLAMLVPSVASRKAGLWWTLPTMAAALLATGSRGGLLAALVALMIQVGPRRWLRPVAIVAPVIGLGLFTLNPITAAERIGYFRSAAIEWMHTSLAFGVGPGHLSLILPGHDWVDVQAHNSLITLAASTGLVGAVLIGLALSNIRRVNFDRVQWATLGALATHSLVDDPLTWLPTMLIAALVLGGRCETSIQVQSATS